MAGMDDLRGGMEGMADKMAGGENPRLTQAVMQMVQNTPGGVQGLLKEFQDKGLGGVVQSLRGQGGQQEISPQQIEQGLGSERINQLAQQSGTDRDQVTQQLSKILPQVMQRFNKS